MFGESRKCLSTMGDIEYLLIFDHCQAMFILFNKRVRNQSKHRIMKLKFLLRNDKLNKPNIINNETIVHSRTNNTFTTNEMNLLKIGLKLAMNPPKIPVEKPYQRC